MDVYVFLYNMTFFITMHKKLRKRYQKINSLQNILHFILVHFDIEYQYLI